MYIGLNTSIVGQHNPSLTQIVSSLFSNGEQGAWYDPSDLSTMYQDAAGTIPVTAVGQPVGKILDKSGRGNHATQATTTSRPTLQQDTSGKYYLSFDGVDDYLSTGSIDFTTTDKMTVLVGVMAITPSFLIICELSNVVNSNNGSFYISCYTSGSYAAGSKGTILADAVSAKIYPYPTTNTITLVGDISGDRSILRVNGSQVSKNTGDQGTGNYGNYPLYIGRRAGATLPFNGRLYGLVVRGALSSTAEITSAESYMNTFTRAY